MKVSQDVLEVKECQIGEVRYLVENYHYSKSVNGVKISHCFKVIISGKVCGAVIFGMLSTTAWKKYGENEADVVELRRFVLTPNCPKNTASKVMSAVLKWMKRNTNFKICVSYADPYYGHVGYIYQATNWSFIGKTNKDTFLKTPSGKVYHSRAMRTKYKGQLKPFAKNLKEMYDSGILELVEVPGKFIYTYNLTGKQIPTGVEDYPKLAG